MVASKVNYGPAVDGRSALGPTVHVRVTKASRSSARWATLALMDPSSSSLPACVCYSGG